VFIFGGTGGSRARESDAAEYEHCVPAALILRRPAFSGRLEGWAWNAMRKPTPPSRLALLSPQDEDGGRLTAPGVKPQADGDTLFIFGVNRQSL